MFQKLCNCFLLVFSKYARKKIRKFNYVRILKNQSLRDPSNHIIICQVLKDTDYAAVLIVIISALQGQHLNAQEPNNFTAKERLFNLFRFVL